MANRWLVLCALAACGKSGSTDHAESAEQPAVTNHALATAPVTAVTAKASTTAFTIELPAALLKPAEVKDAYATWEPKGASFDAPTFTVVATDMALGADETGSPMPIGDDAKDRVIARAEKLPDGGYLHLDERTDHAFFELEVCRPAGSGRLCCTVIQRSQKPLDGFDEIVKLAERVCRSMKSS